MDMQDKEIDALFSGKLKHLEVEPSGKVWKGIMLELDGVRHKSKILPMIRIAASVLVFISAGLFFLLKAGKTPVYTANNIKQKPVKELIDDEGKKTETEETPVVKKPVTEQITNISTAKHLVKITSTPGTAHQRNTEQTNGGLIVNDGPVLAAVENRLVVQATLPDVQLVAQRNLTAANDKFILAGNTGAPDLPMVKQKARRHGIRTLGDLINVVVAKVDKREDKVIEFANTDDNDGSVVSGVNLGLIKIKRDK